MNNNLSSVIAKVQKLLALSGNNPNLHEAQAAAQLADKLIQEYRLTEAQYKSEDASAGFDTLVIYEGGKRSIWRETLLNAICKHYGCSFYFSNARRWEGGSVLDGRNGYKEVRTMKYTAVGLEDDLKLAQYMFAWIEGLLSNMGKAQSKGHGVHYGKQWLIGASRGIRDTFNELTEGLKKDYGQAGLVLVERADMSEKHMLDVVLKGKSKTGRNLSYVKDYSAQNAGYAYGKSVQIKQGLSSGSAKQLR